MNQNYLRWIIEVANQEYGGNIAKLRSLTKAPHKGVM